MDKAICNGNEAEITIKEKQKLRQPRRVTALVHRGIKPISPLPQHRVSL